MTQVWNDSVRFRGRRGRDIAFRQHDQGHTDAPNWSTFLEFCGHYFKSPGLKKA